MALNIILLCSVLILGMADNSERSIRWQIPIGAISDESDVTTFTGFYYSVAMLKEEKREPVQKFELITPVETIEKSNSFQLANAICRQMSNGVFALFGTKSYKSQDILTSYSDRFHMPYVTASPVMQEMIGSYQIHMKPPLNRVLKDLIVFYRWNNISYVYDSEAGLLRYQELRESLQNPEIQITLKMRRLQNVYKAHDDLRSLDLQESRPGIKYILIDLESEETYNLLLKQIREVGMNKENYYYILATQNILGLHIEKFRHGGVHIFGFQLVDYSTFKVKRFINQWKRLSPSLWSGAGTEHIGVGAALAVDAANMLHETINLMVEDDPNVFRSTFRRAEIYNYNTSKGIPCSLGRPWMHGSELITRMKGMTFDGLTGSVNFDKYGIRNNFKLAVYQVALDYGPDKIGEWNSLTGYNLIGEGNKGLVKNETAPRNFKIVISVLEKPFFMLKTDQPKNGSNWTGNDRYEGFSVDLIQEISKICNFDYTLTHSLDGVYGERFSNGSWNGLMALLINQSADISVAPLTITKERQHDVDFSEPFMNSGISIMIKIPEIQKPGVFAFMQPFSLFLWMCIVISYFVVSIGLYLVGRFTPSEWAWTKSCKAKNKHSFNATSSFWFTMGSMMLQGSDNCPRSSAGRIVGGAWWFVVLITISSYTANLAAFLTIEKLLTPIESVDDLIRQTEISYGTIGSGSSQAFFKYSEVPVYKTMWNYMSTAEPSVFVRSMAEGVERVRNMKGKYAFLLESVYNEYFNFQEPCDTMQIGPNLNNKGYGLATPKGSQLRDEISIAVLQLKENGLLIKLKTKWWIERGGCGVVEPHSKSKKRSLSLNKVAGVFFILIGGLVFAIVVGVVHFHKTKTKVQKFGGLFLFGGDVRNTAEIEYTRCPSETTNGRVLTNGNSNGDKPLAGRYEHQQHGIPDLDQPVCQQLGVPDLDHHVCHAIDNSLHGHVKRLSAKKKS